MAGEAGVHDGEGRWQFWIDRGGTFTDVVGRRPDGEIVTHKLLSENPEAYSDAAIQGIRDLLGLQGEETIPANQVEAVKMGTTVATNALLERKGDRTVLAITRGFRDQLRIAYQNRPHLFTRRIELPELLYEQVVEVPERLLADGTVLEPLDEAATRAGLQAAYDAGIRSLAIVLMHGYRFTDHEKRVAEIGREIGFPQISVSHEVSPLMKLVGRGDTTVVDAYLSPILRRYVDQVAGQLGGAEGDGAAAAVRLLFMQSNGGLTDAHAFQGKDSILSGPAGGIVGAVRTAAMGGFEKIITFDMGGTSTDVAHYDGEYERTFETQVAGVRMRAPMMQIHTVAAGGGSILHFDGTRYRVGPDSAGANPGPASYRRGGPLAVTDANVMLGRIQPDFFPPVFGPGADEPLDAEVVKTHFAEMAARIHEATGDERSPEEVAEGFRRIAVENMANAIKKISIQRGYDVSKYTLNCFGGAGGQHACDIADTLGMTRIFLHPYAGVLSAYGMGLADLRVIKEQAVEKRLQSALEDVTSALDTLEAEARGELEAQGVPTARIEILRKVHLRYEGTDSALIVDFGTPEAVVAAFEAAYTQRFGFTMPEKAHVVEAVSVEAIGRTDAADDPDLAVQENAPAPQPAARRAIYTNGAWHDAPVFRREDIVPGHKIDGPAIVIESTSTTVVDPGWRAALTGRNHLVLERVVPLERAVAVGTQVDPVMLEIFNNLFMSIAEQMGSTLEKTAYSVNIKERLDFSCALFTPTGDLVANAPHMPVHLGSMSESIRAVIRQNRDRLAPGDVYMLNAPYNGGTHLPDITVVTPVFNEAESEILFYVASRGHHADVGGTTPGSMPPDSRTVEEEGVLIDNFKLVEQGRFREAAVRELLSAARYPARNPDQNVADLKAQIAANQKGVSELRRIVGLFGLEVVQAYMRHVQDNAEEQVRRVLDRLAPGSFVYPMDDGSQIAVSVSIDRAARSARIDFTGTSAQLPNNFNAPSAVCRAAVLYVFRTLVEDEIPMNEGCLKPLDIVIPEGSMLNPVAPAAVVAGNVETSQAITDCLYGATKALSGAQGTMNNLTFGSDRYQYYETIAGGSGAGEGFDGCDAVHTHMTNARLTDPEVLEWRFPVLLESFEIRRGSGGKGHWRGGDGTIRRLRFLEPMTASILSSHRKVPNFGLEGGEPGALGRNAVARKDGRVEELSGTDKAEMQPGDTFLVETPGGGGYGKA
ncbi:hydantoinase B/oxoprolinase family protein [Aquibaculum arenosum]|uniref:Hydantoinase B/oxoprolinase family protein n=1 Tax=Aquibaculum arenosum TaxID=3032591 RepID=A0ABT5YLM2_9PROT|nr:hydantoinase B/oxoprolinase family protein [Fodinicurvata sp. CAU 1616]MDF2095748.1 hydantoinase B/oxoprolinase family protein [Fodinicurvata sp. CAU 1616]